jgi:hypothetical protein
MTHEMDINNKKLFLGLGEVKEIKKDILMHEQAMKAEKEKLECNTIDLRWFPDLSDEELKTVIQAIDPKSDFEQIIKLKLNSTYVWRTGKSILKEND